MFIPYLDLDNKTLLFGPDTTRRATTPLPLLSPSTTKHTWGLDGWPVVSKV